MNRITVIGRLCAVLAAVWVVVVRGEPCSAQIQFRETTREAGLVEPLQGIMGHGGAWGDFDGDGRLDLYVGGFCDRPNEQYQPADGPVPNRLFRNLGNGRFELVPRLELGNESSVEFYGRTSGAVFADVDNDGLPELYVSNNAKPRSARAGVPEPQRSAKAQLSKLFQNTDGRLVDISASSGACPEALHTARNVGVFDYDGDGLLDLLVLEDHFTRSPRSVLLRNRGGLQFKDVTAAVGLPDDLFGLGLAVADVNGDHRPDFFVGHSNRFFLSRGDGTYFEPASLRQTFAWEPLHAEDWPCGAAFGDLNGDGRLDLVLSIHCTTARNRVYLNEGLKDGVPRFRDVTAAVGFPDSIPVKCPHVEIQDFDNDGRPDVYFSAGWLDADGTFTPLVFRNTGIKDRLPRFVPLRPLTPPPSPREPGGSTPRLAGGEGEDGTMVYFPAGPSADYDNDGRVDLFLINWFQGNRCRLMRNESPQHNWLDVQVVGRTFNRMGVGSRIRIYEANRLGEAEALTGLQEVSIGYGYASGQVAVCHFGLGEQTAVDVDMTLPNGKPVRLKNVRVNRRLVIEEP